ncbi:uncharacterized protein LOC106659715 [Trichogramma pretiosum]|uniref:uncharacterized protein LOC106659715 n=1 Tax=Trichogramma pretiosum TaxID=7493 RepID=UPI0006C98730|nr:uncharacterized protein LOC106659715 [Trichogramma pretiosum]XP_023318845.1 uncharacterized protein LOC106659715 [Trichogramma pretiosum]
MSRTILEDSEIAEENCSSSSRIDGAQTQITCRFRQCFVETGNSLGLPQIRHRRRVRRAKVLSKENSLWLLQTISELSQQVDDLEKEVNLALKKYFELISKSNSTRRDKNFVENVDDSKEDMLIIETSDIDSE